MNASAPPATAGRRAGSVRAGSVRAGSVRAGSVRTGNAWAGSVRVSRGRLVAVEAAAGAAFGGAVLRGPIGWPVLAAAGLALLLAVARRNGRWLTEGLAAGSRRTAGAAEGAAGADLGAVAGVVARLTVDECTDRNGYPLGIAWDGQGLAAAVELDAGTSLRIDLGALAAHAAADDVRLAGVQLLVEQVRVPALEAAGFAPTAVYRTLAAELPLVRRVWVALRYEPIWAPEAARRRGDGGADGARLALAAALARMRVRLLGRGMSATPLDAAALTRVLRGVGDPGLTRELRKDSWVTSAGVHQCLGARLASAADWTRLLGAAAASPADRTVLSLAADLDGRLTRTRSAVRLVTTDAATAVRARQQLMATGLVRPLRGEQAAGVLATLPLGGGPRPLASAIGWVAE
jgi:type VII secretion protein EccE